MATADDYAAWIVKNADKRGTPDFKTVVQAYQAAKAAGQPKSTVQTYDPSEGDATLQVGPFDTGIKIPQGVNRFLAGTGKAFSDLGAGVQQIAAGVADVVAPRSATVSDIITNGGKPVSRVDQLRSQVAEQRKLDAPLMATGAGKAGNIAGNVALFAPTALIPGANTITGGALVGAASGLLQPSTSTGETLTNVGVGGVAGALVPAVVRGVKVLKATAEPFYQNGQGNIIGRALRNAAGKDAPAVINRLEEAAAPFVGPSQGDIPRTLMGEYVPGSIPTVGQASENAGVSALERAAVATNPEVTNAVSDIAKTQNAARVGMLDEMAGAGGAKTAAVASRDAAANQAYGAARRAGIDASALTPEAQANIAQFQARMPAEVIDYAKKLAQINGTPMDNGSALDGLHWSKMALDGLIGKAKAAGDANLARAYTALQQDLLTGMDNMSPAYAAARGAYAQASKPINQMEIAQALRDKSVNPLTDALMPSSYAKALRNPKLAANATSFNGATLEGTMEPAQLNALESLLLDVQRSTAAQNAGRGAGSDTVQKLAYSNLIDQAGVPTFLRDLAPAQIAGNLASRVGDVTYSRANAELSNRLAQVMLDPKAAAELMRRATPAQQNAILNLAQKAGSGLATSTPAIANAQK